MKEDQRRAYHSQLANLFSGYRAEWLNERVFELFSEPSYFPQLDDFSSMFFGRWARNGQNHSSSVPVVSGPSRYTSKHLEPKPGVAVRWVVLPNKYKQSSRVRRPRAGVHSMGANVWPLRESGVL